MNLSRTSLFDLVEAKHKPQPGVRDSEGRKIPRKYLRGLSAKKQKQMKHEIKSFRDKPDDHKEAYKPWTADRGVKPKKKSKATKLYHRMFGEDVIYESSDSGLAKKAAQSGIPLSILRQVFNRGMAAWKTGHRPGVAQQQWAYGRVNSFITGSGGARKADADLWTKAKRAKKQEESVNLVRTPLLLEGECDTKQAGKPWRTPGGPKKFAVCVDGKLVRFGDPNLEIKRDDPERRKNFRARHNCASPGPRTKAKYWACKTWEKGRSVGDVVGEAIAERDEEERRWEREAAQGDTRSADRLRRRHVARSLDTPVEEPAGLAGWPRQIHYTVTGDHDGDRAIERHPPLSPEERGVTSRRGAEPTGRSRLRYGSTVGERAETLRDVRADLKTIGAPRRPRVLRPGKRFTQPKLGEPNLRAAARAARTPEERAKVLRNKPASRTQQAIAKLRKTWEKGRTVGDVVSEGRLARTLGGLALGAATMFGGAGHAKASDNPPSMTYARSNVGELTRRLHQQAGEMQRKDTAETESARSREFAQRRAAIYKMPRHKQAGALNDLHTAFHATPGMTDAVGSHRFMQRVLDRK